jgi:hypothetical protein
MVMMLVLMIVAAAAMLVVIMVVMMLVLMIVAAAAMLTVFMVVMMLVLMIVAAAAMFVVIMVVMMLVLMIVAAAAMLTVFMVVMMLMLMIVAAAAMLTVFMVMMMLVLMMMTTAMVLLMVMVMMGALVLLYMTVMMLVAALVAMVVTAAVMLFLMMVMATAALLMIVVMMVVVVFVLMIVTAAAMLLMLMMVVMLVLLLQLGQLCCQGCLAFHGLQQLCAGELIPGSGDNGGLLIVLPDQGNGGIQLILGHHIGTGQDDGGSSFDLVVIELTKVLHVDLHLTGIADSHGVTQGHILIGHLLHSADHIGQLAHAGGLDNDAVGVVLCDDLLQSLAEVTHQGAADAAGVHLGDVDACILQEAAVDADLTKFILDEHQLLTGIGLLDHFLNEGGLACTQETTVNINLGHSRFFLQKI